ncbi:MAG: LarC family nickel insertion protein, partial [Candidatus Methanomethyliaceae archaeon]|nr:LarC family nickel insertion protein [Candidatus Methanomethyliaceae archaeon]
MKIVVIDSSMAGASGDKILSAFVDLGGDRLKLEIERLIANVIGDKLFYFDRKESYGFTGIKAINNLADVRYRNLMEILENFSDKFQLGSWGRTFVNEVASIILDTEKEIHGKEDLHDLKELDFVLEIICTAKAIEILGMDNAQFFTTPLKIGVGWTKCGHGIIPLPAPATLNIVKKFSMPIFLSSENEEFTTPT